MMLHECCIKFIVLGHGKGIIDSHHSFLQIVSKRYGTENKASTIDELLEKCEEEEQYQSKRRSNVLFARVFKVT